MGTQELTGAFVYKTGKSPTDLYLEVFECYLPGLCVTGTAVNRGFPSYRYICLQAVKKQGCGVHPIRVRTPESCRLTWSRSEMSFMYIYDAGQDPVYRLFQVPEVTRNQE